MKKFLPLLIIILAATAALVIAGFIRRPSTPPPSHSQTAPEVTYVAPETGPPTDRSSIPVVLIPQGSQTYQIMQAATAMPKFVQVTVDPVNAHVGDVQTLTAIISDSYPIGSVVAHIQTDNGTTSVPLRLVGPAALNDIAPERYFVDADDQLALTRPARQSISNVAFAAGGSEEFSAQWTVRDTHTARYVTSFTATDAQGNSNSATLGWTDAVCSWNGDNNNNGETSSISVNFGADGCTFQPGATDGLENGNLLIDAPVTLVPGSSLVVNPGYSLSFSGSGQLSIPAGAEIQFSEMYCSGSGWVTSFSDPADGTNEVPRSELSNSVFPGQTAYFTSSTLTNYGSDTWNYNCAPTTTVEYGGDGGITVPGGCNGSYSCITPQYTSGYVGTSSCGSGVDTVTYDAHAAECQSSENQPDGYYCDVAYKSYAGLQACN